MNTYEVIDTELGTSIKMTCSDGTEWFIPTDPANRDYQAYLAWVAKGNEAEEIVSF